jgi:hypothetical protein
MEYKKYGSYLATLSVALSAAIVPFSLEVPQLNAQPLYVSLGFPRTPVGRPRTSVGGGTGTARPVEQVSCFNKGSHITVLSPHNNVVTTVSAQPTLFWHIPKTQAKSADFFVVDEEDNIVYQTKLALIGTPGVVKLALPRTVVLETGKEYQWTLTLNCNPADETQMEMVEGKIKRTALTSTQKSQLAAAKQPLEQAEVYAKAKIWQETISILAQMRQERPSDRTANTAWKELLESVGLKDVASAPLIECCKADK